MFNVKAVEWSHQFHRRVKGVAEAPGSAPLHAVTLAKGMSRGAVRHEAGQNPRLMKKTIPGNREQASFNFDGQPMWPLGIRDITDVSPRLIEHMAIEND